MCGIRNKSLKVSYPNVKIKLPIYFERPLPLHWAQGVIIFYFSNTLRVTRSKQLSSTSGHENTVFLGKPDKDFSFSHVPQYKLSFVECSAVGGESTIGVANVTTWLDKMA